MHQTRFIQIECLQAWIIYPQQMCDIVWERSCRIHGCGVAQCIASLVHHGPCDGLQFAIRQAPDGHPKCERAFSALDMRMSRDRCEPQRRTCDSMRGHEKLYV